MKSEAPDADMLLQVLSENLPTFEDEHRIRKHLITNGAVGLTLLSAEAAHAAVMGVVTGSPAVVSGTGAAAASSGIAASGSAAASSGVAASGSVAASSGVAVSGSVAASGGAALGGAGLGGASLASAVLGASTGAAAASGTAVSALGAAKVFLGSVVVASAVTAASWQGMGNDAVVGDAVVGRGARSDSAPQLEHNRELEKAPAQDRRSLADAMPAAAASPPPNDEPSVAFTGMGEARELSAENSGAPRHTRERGEARQHPPRGPFSQNAPVEEPSGDASLPSDGQLIAEAGLLRQALVALREGDFEEAERKLALHERQFSDGALAIERGKMRARLQLERDER